MIKLTKVRTSYPVFYTPFNALYDIYRDNVLRMDEMNDDSPFKHAYANLYTADALIAWIYLVMETETTTDQIYLSCWQSCYND